MGCADPEGRIDSRAFYQTTLSLGVGTYIGEEVVEQVGIDVTASGHDLS